VRASKIRPGFKKPLRSILSEAPPDNRRSFLLFITNFELRRSFVLFIRRSFSDCDILP
jgi:hypothetical protein